MTVDSYISNLYNQGIVSGSTFLYCVENSIDTVDGLLAIADNIPDYVMADIKYLKSELGIYDKTNDNNNHNLIIDEETNSEVKRVDYIELYQIYLELKKGYDVRTNNCLNQIEQTICGSDQEAFIKYILEISQLDVLKIRNAGRKTSFQITDLSKSLRKFAKIEIDELSRGEVSKPGAERGPFLQDVEWCDSILPIIISLADNYSVRSKNAILSLINSCNHNVCKLYEMFASPNFDPYSIKKIGRKSVPEIIDFKNRVISLCNEYSSTENISNLEKANKVLQLKEEGIKHPEYIIKLEEKLGHFPLLAATNQFIISMPAREYKIVGEYLLVLRGGTEKELDDIANELSLTRERIRQLANKQINTFEGLINSWKGFLVDYHYPIFEKDAWLTMCEREGVAFTQNFVKWLISLVDDTVHLIGDPISAFKTYHGRIKPLYLMPKRLYNIFDIHSFIEHINNLASEKRYEEERYNLRELIYNFFRGRVLFEIVEELEDFARRIIDYEVDCLLYEGNLIFRANTVKNAPEIIEDIIRANGDVMSLDEIYERYKELYPLKEVEPKNIRASIHQNKNIKPIGRSGRYTLSEWKNGYARGGTIREFAYECIVNSPAKIVRIDALCEYISQFRRDVEEDSIQSNLLAEASGKFGLYFYDGDRYIGLTSVQYDDCYIAAINDENSERRSTKQSYTLLENFIVEHKRFPFSSGPDDEPRLYRFWYNQTYCYTHGDIDAENKQIYDYIDTKYGHYKVSQCDYIWHRTFVELRDLVKLQCFGDIKNRHNKWLLQNAELYRNKQLAEWQVPLFKELIQLIMLD